MLDSIKLNNLRIVGLLCNLLFPFSEIRVVQHPKIVCPACGAPQKDLMPQSELCFRCYWWAMAIFTSKRYGGKSGSLQRA